MKFAAFIMTYERPAILQGTIQRMHEQSFPPQKILIVDNSLTDETKQMVASLNDPLVEYFRVGYNSGPAGAARIGLQMLSAQGYEWIHWADDDDPAAFSDAFEMLLHQVNDRIGIIGAVGARFNWKTGLNVRLKDEELNGLQEVDAIGGGYCMIVNAKAISPDTLPDEKLFFGMEEFDFCQRVKRSGYSVCVDGQLMFRYRKLNNKLGVEKKPSLIPRRSGQHLHREYYSYRNALYLMLNTYKKPSLVMRYLVRVMGKIMFGFSKGPRYGVRNASLLLKAVAHAFTNKMGKLI